jgi:hypothetical protein
MQTEINFQFLARLKVRGIAVDKLHCILTFLQDAACHSWMGCFCAFVLQGRLQPPTETTKSMSESRFKTGNVFFKGLKEDTSMEDMVKKVTLVLEWEALIVPGSLDLVGKSLSGGIVPWMQCSNTIVHLHVPQPGCG